MKIKIMIITLLSLSIISCSIIERDAVRGCGIVNGIEHTNSYNSKYTLTVDYVNESQRRNFKLFVYTNKKYNLGDSFNCEAD